MTGMNTVVYYRMVNSGFGLQYYPCSAPQQLTSSPTTPAAALSTPVAGGGGLTQAAGLPGPPALAAPAPAAPGLGTPGLSTPGIMTPAAKWVFPNFSSTQIQYMFRPRLDRPRQNKAVRCETCNITLNSEQQAQQHYSGKNHLKKVRQMGKDGGGGDEEKGDEAATGAKRESSDSREADEGVKRLRRNSASSCSSSDTEDKAVDDEGDKGGCSDEASAACDDDTATRADDEGAEDEEEAINDAADSAADNHNLVNKSIVNESETDEARTECLDDETPQSPVSRLTSTGETCFGLKESEEETEKTEESVSDDCLSVPIVLYDTTSSHTGSPGSDADGEQSPSPCSDDGDVDDCHRDVSPLSMPAATARSKPSSSSSSSLVSKSSIGPSTSNEHRPVSASHLVSASSPVYRSSLRLQQTKSLLGSPVGRYGPVGRNGVSGAPYVVPGCGASGLSASLYSRYTQQLTADNVQQNNPGHLTFPSSSALTVPSYGLSVPYASADLQHQSLPLGSLYSNTSLTNNLSGLEGYASPGTSLLSADSVAATSPALRPSDMTSYLASTVTGVQDTSSLGVQRLKYNMESNLLLDSSSVAYQPYASSLYQSVAVVGEGDQLLPQNHLLLQSAQSVSVLDQAAQQRVAGVTSPPLTDINTKVASHEDSSKMDPISQAVYDNIMGKLPVRRKRDLYCKQCDLSLTTDAQARDHFRSVRHNRRSGGSVGSDRTETGPVVRW